MSTVRLKTAVRHLAEVLRAENEALRLGDLAEAARLLPEKVAAAAALRDALPDATPDPVMAETLRRLSTENSERLCFAIEVQGRILDMVARAARLCAPPPARYGRGGTLAGGMAAQALALRA